MIPPVPKKAQKIGRALKTAALFPARVSGGRGSGRSTFSHNPGEQPIVLLRLQVLGCKDLSRSKHNSCDPFVVVSLLNTRHHTPVIKRNANPEYTLKDATFDFPIYLSLADRLGTVEIVVWDRDNMLRKEYLGEVALPLEDWFKGGNAFSFNHDQNRPSSLSLVSTRATTHASGSVQIKLGFVPPSNAILQMGFGDVFRELNKRSRPSLVSAPPTEGIGTLRSHLSGPAFEDDGGISSDEDDNDSEDDDDDDIAAPQLSRLYIPPPVIRIDKSPGLPQETTPVTARPSPAVGSTPPVTPTSRSKLPKLFIRRPPLSTRPSYEGAPTPTPNATDTTVPSISIAPPPATTTGRVSPCPPSSPIPPHFGHRRSASAGSIPTMSTTSKKRFKRSWAMSKSADFNFSAANDVVGIVMLEIQRATDLPRLKNMTRTGWDMDPFVVISFGKKVFRTRIIRHSLNPTWDEKLLFHVRRYETAFKVQMSVLDWDKLSSNDHVGDARFDVSELVKDAPQPDPKTGLYDEDDRGSHSMKEFHLPLVTVKETSAEVKPLLHFRSVSSLMSLRRASELNLAMIPRAKFQPYDALRQRFWAQFLQQYDTDDTNALSHLEITSMLDSLGSTLSTQTIDSFFLRFGKRPAEDELTISEAIMCLENELCRPRSERRRLNTDDSFADSGSSPTPDDETDSRPPSKSFLEGLDFGGPPLSLMLNDESPTENSYMLPSAPEGYPTEQSQRPVTHVAEPLSTSCTTSILTSYRKFSLASSDSEEVSSTGGLFGSSINEDHHFERVINIKNCPLCHRPRLNSKAEMDIVTHLAICASQDWAKVDRIVVGNFVTPSQAQRKWYTKVITKVSSGNYKLGANSANIIVQNRLTGQLEEEKMQVYVRLGIRLLYKGARGRMEGARARRLLKSLSIKQGIKYDSPESTRNIQAFIDFHKLSVDEFLDPVDSFRTFNEFFYRKLKPGARPIDLPADPTRLVSAADCRLMAFETVTEATRLWIKGRDFTIGRLLGDSYHEDGDRYVGGALAIFRTSVTNSTKNVVKSVVMCARNVTIVEGASKIMTHSDNYDNYGSHPHGRGRFDDDDDVRRPAGLGRGYTPPSGPPPFAGTAGRGPAGFSSQGGLDRGDFASDADIQRMVTSGEFNERPKRQEFGSGYGGSGGRFDAPSGPPPGHASGYGDRDRTTEYASGRYDLPQGPPPGRQEGSGSGGGYGTSYGGSDRRDQYTSQTQGRAQYDSPQGPPPGHGKGQSKAPSGGFGDQYTSQKTQGRPPYEEEEEQSRQEGYGTGGGYGGGPDRRDQYASRQTQGRTQYDSPQGGPPGQGKGQGNAPTGGFSASRDEGDSEYSSGYGKSGNNHNETSRRGEAASYYNQQGSSAQDDRYTHLAGLAAEHGDNPEEYRRATQGLHEKIQAQSGQPKRNNDDDYKAQLDAHRKAYGDEDHGPMDADAIGKAAAMEAFKQSATSGGSSNAPAGAFKTGKGGDNYSSKSGRPPRDDEVDEEEETAGSRSGGSGGLQDKMMALAMSQAGKLFDKKNAGSGGGGDSGGKAQAMQSAAATAMQLFGKYQSGKLDSSDMSSVMTLAMKMM
ncbi:hypothetical protein JVU11DRAFT_3853 [Chiua virens]|nr:hypothetical protein JVU11DRAFT_3853 [Chiua virens]